MTALTAKAAWWVLEGWKGSPGSVRNDSFDGQSGHLRPGSLRNDSLDGQSCLVVLKGWKGSPGSLRNDSFDGQSGQCWIP